MQLSSARRPRRSFSASTPDVMPSPTHSKLGFHVQGDSLNGAFVRFKELADKKVEITEADLEAIVAEELGTGLVHRYTIQELELHGGTASKPMARVVLGHDDGKIEANGTGDGMIDAAIAAISEATGTGTLGNFQVSSVTGGSDALGAVAVTVEADGHKVTGRGVATDVVKRPPRVPQCRQQDRPSRRPRRSPRFHRRPVSTHGAGLAASRDPINKWVDPEWALRYLRERDAIRIASRGSR